MPLMSNTIPGLFNGVSQQPTTVRNPTQCEEQINMYSSLVSGLTKRQPTDHIKSFGTGLGNLTTNALMHLINRDSTERYVCLFANNDLWICDLDGNVKTVAFPTGKSYITTADPRRDLKVVTVADYSFIVNTAKTVAKDTTRTSSGTIVASVQLFSDLPSQAPEGSIYEIAGDPTNKFDNYYVKRVGGVYVETIKPGEYIGLDASTMPHNLVRLGDGTFELRRATWVDRGVGDDKSTPYPSFVSNTITNVFLHRNRLGFTSRENVIFSVAGDYFNFFRETVLDVVDSDPVDVGVTHTKVSVIKHAIPFNKTLLLFSDQTQFALTGADALTPKTVKIDQVTEFEINSAVKPVGCGPNLYFVNEKGGYTGVKEYYVAEGSLTNDAADVTRHVPTYVPGGVFKIAASSTEDILFLLSSTTPNTIYVYKYYWQGDQKEQASWSKWTLGSDAIILGMDVINSSAYLLVQRASGLHLERLDFQVDKVDTLGWLVHLDRKITSTGTYSGITGKTTWTLPYQEVASPFVILGPAWGADAGSQLDITKEADDRLTITGNYSGSYVFIGTPYTAAFTFSQFHRQVNGLAALGVNMQLKTLTVDFVNSGYFQVKVLPRARSVYIYPYAGAVLGVGNIILGKPNIGDGRYRVPIQCSPQDVTIKLVNATAYPCSFQSAEWEAYIVQRAQPT